MDPIVEWERLNRSVNLAYYIGKPAVEAIAAAIEGTSPEPRVIGIDVDNDGVVDTKLTLKKTPK